MVTKKNALIIALIFSAIVITYFAVSVVTLNLALTARASEIQRFPSELGLGYKDIEFPPRDENSIRLKVWCIPAEKSKAVGIGVHGLDSNREHLLELAPAINQEGFSLLLFDLRGHGLSDKARMGAGLEEVKDIQGAIDFAVSNYTSESNKIFLHGISYGAAAALLAGHQESDVAGVLSDSAFASLTDLIIGEVADRTYLPLWGAELLRPGLTRSAKIFKGIDLDEVLPAEAAGEYDYPLGLVHCKADQRVEITHLAQIRAKVQEPPWIVAYTNCEHASAQYDHREHYVASALNYFNSRLESLSGIAE